jgi:nitrous oxidase accessory protein
MTRGSFHAKGWRIAGAVALTLLLLRHPHASPTAGATAEGWRFPAPAAPAHCRAVPPGEPLQAVLDSAPEGSSLCLLAGWYAGPIVVRRPLALWGPRAAVVGSQGQGSTVEVLAGNVQLLGFTVRGSGSRFDQNDSAVRIHGAHVLVEGVRVEGALFGLSAEQSSQVTFRGNEIIGDPAKPTGLRGDSIRLWESGNSLLENNFISHGRDILIWYSPHVRIAGNVVADSRYGTHFMFNRDAQLEANRYLRNTVAVFAMYSHEITLRDNLAMDSSGPDGIGFGVKDSDGLLYRGNILLRNTVGLYVDGSPSRPEDSNRFERNLFGRNGEAIVFHGSENYTGLTDNIFRGNQSLVSVEGNGDAMGVLWRGNYYDLYQGYDLNHDGRGDVPFEYRSLSNDLVTSYPQLALLRGSPALGLVDFLGHVFPLLSPRLILTDPSPRMSPPDVEVRLAR